MSYFTNIALSAVISLVISYGLVSYVPLNFFPDFVKHNFGSTITTIQGSDTISGSRSTINTNFANLNADKAENTVTSLGSLTTASVLASIGTITTGIWNGTPIGVTYGGTGTTSPTSNLVFLGNGSSGFKTVNGFGTSGQFLVSQGAGVPPQWASASVDQTQSYTWTGLHVFNGGVVVNNASTTITGTLNVGVVSSPSFNFTNGLKMGTVVDVAGSYYNLYYTTSTTSARFVKIPANTMSSTSMIRLRAYGFLDESGTPPDGAEVLLGNGSATTTIAGFYGCISSSGCEFEFSSDIFFQTASNQYAITTLSTTTPAAVWGPAGGPTQYQETSTKFLTSSSYSTTGNLYLNFAVNGQNALNTARFNGIVVEILGQ